MVMNIACCLKNISRPKQFAKDVYKLTGRSPTALFDAPYSPTRSLIREWAANVSTVGTGRTDRGK